jgi:holliday junction DNA helicase RuvA
VIEPAEPPRPLPRPLPHGPAPPRARTRPRRVAQSEAMSALTNLGYAPVDAAGAIARAAQDAPGQPTPALIRAALKLLAPKG